MKINKYFKKIFIITLSFFLCFLSYKLCYFIAEKYFFDKFFYQKSSQFGYWSINLSKRPLTLSDFGDRAKDIYDLETNYSDPTLLNNQSVYKIAIYGDSYVWGQGIKNNQRFAKILENKLNKIRPTKVYSFSESADNLVNDYQKYKLTPKIFGPMDLNIFGLVDNDLLFNDHLNNRYYTQEYLSSVSYFGCTGPEYIDNYQGDDKYIDKIKYSLESNSKNYCLYQKLVPLLPKEKSIYMNLSVLAYMSTPQTAQKFNDLLLKNLPILQSFNNQDIFLTPPNRYNVSKLDTHPSALANQIYAQVLYQEITTNPKWNFK